MPSVAMCTFNGERFLRKQIESILQQSVAVDEIAIADDASTDGTKEILLEYQDRFPKIFRLHFQPSNLGPIKNFEFILGQCRGDIIFLSDQDDIWGSKKVEITLKYFARHKRCLLLFTDADLIDSYGRALGTTLWESWNFNALWRLRWKLPGFALSDLSYNINKVTGATIALRRALLEKSLPIRLPHGYWHDAWLALHAAAQGGLSFVPDRLINFRIHPGQQVGLMRGVAARNPDSISQVAFFDDLKRQYPYRSVFIGRPSTRQMLKSILVRQ